MNDRFHRAAKDGLLTILKEATKRDLNQVDGDGMTPTLWSAYTGNLSALKLCCSRGGDPNKSDHTGNSALHLAAQNGHLHLVSFLVIFGANVWHVDNSYHTALDIAGIRKQTDCVKYLDNAANKKLMEDPKKAKRMQDEARKEAMHRIEKYERMQQKYREKMELDSRRKESTGEAPQIPKARSFPSIKKLKNRLTIKKPPPGLSAAMDRDTDSTQINSAHSSQVTYRTTEEMKDMENKLDDTSDNQKRKAVKDVFPNSNSFPTKKGDFGTMAFRNNFSTKGLYSALPETEKPPEETDGEVVLAPMARPKMNGYDEEEGAKFDVESSSDEDAGDKELRNFIASLGLTSYLPLFEQNDMDMESLTYCTDDDLHKMGLNLGPRKKVIQGLKRRKLEEDMKISDAEMTTF
uniref:Ankyrin repeat and SAM domain-containing protein 4B n=1 Tax=Phallusia mammillata TaxID=59560 RepID=A0A6F9D6N9_9ASCI|nr:ankyrin repeat and SAM domain-containing protein 4B [Phallusia mammillata]